MEIRISPEFAAQLIFRNKKGFFEVRLMDDSGCWAESTRVNAEMLEGDMQCGFTNTQTVLFPPAKRSFVSTYCGGGFVAWKLMFISEIGKHFVDAGMVVRFDPGDMCFLLLGGC